MSLRYVLLGLLTEQPQTGYEVQKALDASVSYYWQATFQQTYGELRRLEREGLIEGRQVPRGEQALKTIYSVTPKGEAALDRWLDHPSRVAPVRYEFLVRMFQAQRMPRERALARVREHRRSHEERLTTYRMLRARLTEAGVTDTKVPEPLLGRYLTLQFGITYEEQSGAWCDWAIGILETNRVPTRAAAPARAARSRSRPRPARPPSRAR